jgi:hypothetical protein
VPKAAALESPAGRLGLLAWGDMSPFARRRILPVRLYCTRSTTARRNALRGVARGSLPNSACQWAGALAPPRNNPGELAPHVFLLLPPHTKLTAIGLDGHRVGCAHVFVVERHLAKQWPTCLLNNRSHSNR